MSPEHSNPTEYAGRVGAERIAAAIRNYWFARGGVVNTTVKQGAFSMTLRYSPWYVRSDMVDGYPREWVGRHT